MNPRVEYEMSEEDLKAILDACKPVIVMKIGSYEPASQQENANRAWEMLGRKMGFDSMTVRPIERKGMRFFTAVPSETAAQRAERVSREAETERVASIAKHEAAIAEHQAALDQLRSQVIP